MIRITTSVEVIDSSFDSDANNDYVVGLPKQVVNNLIVAKSGSTSPEMTYNHADTKTWEFDTARGSAFTLDIMTLIHDATAAEVVGIHIFCYKKKLLAQDKHDTRLFNLSVGANSFGAMSQFTLMNIAGFPFTNLTVSNIVVPANEQAVLKVMFILNKA